MPLQNNYSLIFPILFLITLSIPITYQISETCEEFCRQNAPDTDAKYDPYEVVCGYKEKNDGHTQCNLSCREKGCDKLGDCLPAKDIAKVRCPELERPKQPPAPQALPPPPAPEPVPRSEPVTPPPAPASSTSKSKDDDMTPVYIIVGIVVGILLVGGLIGLFFYCSSRNQKNQNGPQIPTQNHPSSMGDFPVQQSGTATATSSEYTYYTTQYSS